MSISDAIKESSDGVIIDLEVTPGTRTVQVPSGYNPWRKRIEVRLSQAARKGRANQQLLEELSEVLGIRTSSITLVSGQTSHRKSVLIKGVTPGYVIDIMGQLIEKT